MALETVTHISDLVPANPTAGDPKNQGDDHIRNIKAALKTDFPNITGPVSATQTELNQAVGVTSPLQGQLNAKAPLASPAFTGTPTAPTAVPGSSGTQLATLDYANALAMAAALPGQSGYSAKYSVKTNGATASWQLTLPAQAGYGGRFLSSNGADESWACAGMKLAPAAGGALVDSNCYHAFIANAAYTLPDFTGSLTFGVASLTNSTGVPATVQTSDGWTIAPGLTAGTYKAVSPTSTATPHGTWGVLAMTPPVIATLAAGGAPTVMGTVQLSAGPIVVLYTVGANGYVVALNPTTGLFGTPQPLGTASANGNIPMTIYADSASSFVCGYQGVANVTVIAGSVSGLGIVLGSPVTGTFPMYTRLVQLSAGTYFYINTPIVEVFVTSSVTVVAKGTATNVLPGANYGTCARINGTQFLMASFSTNGSPAQLQAVVVTVTGTTPTPGSVASAATTILRGSTPLRFLRPVGAAFICCAQDNTTSTTGDYYGITVSGTNAVIGGVLQIANALPNQAEQSTWQYAPANDSAQAVVSYNASTLLVGIPTGAIAVSISGTLLANGPVFGGASTTFSTDVATGANFYSISSTVNKITISGTTINSSYQLSVAPVIVSSDTLNDKAANYSGTWYSWTLPAMAFAATANKWLGGSGSNLNLYGPIA